MDIDNLKDPLELVTTIRILEGAQDLENGPQRKTREARNKKAMRFFEHKEDKRIQEEKRKFGGMRRYDTDNKKSIPYLALVTDGKRVFSRN